MQSNIEPYNRAEFAEPAREKDKAGADGVILLTPGASPVCAVCAKSCHTHVNDDYHLQVGPEDTPALCRSCKSVVCQRCVISATQHMDPKRCCEEAKGFDYLLPFVYCEGCGNRALLISSSVEGEATYQLLNKGAVPLRCTGCNVIRCSVCLSKSAPCQKCGDSKADFFVPGYMGTGVVVAQIDGCRITLAVPGSPSAMRAKKAADQTAEKQRQQVAVLVDRLNAPGYKFWIDKSAALSDLAALGGAAQEALPVVRAYLGRSGYSLDAVRVLSAAGRVAKDQVLSLVEMLGADPRSAAAAALALGCLAAKGIETTQAEIALLQVLDRGRVQGDTGVRCTAAFGLMALGKLSAERVTDLAREHAVAATSDPGLFPTENDFQQLMVARGSDISIELP